MALQNIVRKKAPRVYREGARPENAHGQCGGNELCRYARQLCVRAFILVPPASKQHILRSSCRQKRCPRFQNVALRHVNGEYSCARPGAVFGPNERSMYASKYMPKDMFGRCICFPSARVDYKIHVSRIVACHKNGLRCKHLPTHYWIKCFLVLFHESSTSTNISNCV